MHWIDRLKALKGKYTPAIREEARRKARPRRKIDDGCAGCPHLAKVLAQASYQAGGLRSKGICQSRECRKDKGDEPTTD